MAQTNPKDINFKRTGERRSQKEEGKILPLKMTEENYFHKRKKRKTYTISRGQGKVESLGSW